MDVDVPMVFNLIPPRDPYYLRKLQTPRIDAIANRRDYMVPIFHIRYARSALWNEGKA